MGKATGFMEYTRKNFTYRPAAERVKDFKEFTGLQPEKELQKQGARCMDCGIPFCHSMGCPVYNLIPEWNDLIYKGKWREAWQRLELTNNLPEVTGRICPAPCEASCTLSINSAPVSIKQIELAIIEKAFASGWVVPMPPPFESGKRVAVIGSGPAGLAAAQQLRRQGHTVVVFERDSRIGGILRYGIPDFKLEKTVLDRRIEQMKAEGIIFETNADIGEDLSARYIRQKYDAILLTMGAGEPRDLPVAGRGLENIHFAMEYLTKMNKYLTGELKEHEIISAKGKKVLVIGGGDTGADCIGTANRQGAASVHQFEILPKPRTWNKTNNPEWPAWPNILRTGSSHEEGCERRWSVMTKQFTGRGVKVAKAHCMEVTWDRDPESDRYKMKEVAGSDFSLDVDLVILAMGFLHVKHSKLLHDLGVTYDTRGNIKTDGNYATSVPGVFAAGDADIGASLIVRAIYHGRCAAEITSNTL
ncbi:MAG: glutamate synthase subunit beta [Spirochaetia bacterium]